MPRPGTSPPPATPRSLFRGPAGGRSCEPPSATRPPALLSPRSPARSASVRREPSRTIDHVVALGDAWQKAHRQRGVTQDPCPGGKSSGSPPSLEAAIVGELDDRFRVSRRWGRGGAGPATGRRRRGRAAVGRGGSGELRLGGEAATPPARPVHGGRDGLIVDFYNGSGRSGRRSRANRRRRRSEGAPGPLHPPVRQRFEAAVLPYGVAVGTALAGGPPRRSQRARLTHWAPALGNGVKALSAASRTRSSALGAPCPALRPGRVLLAAFPSADPLPSTTSAPPQRRACSTASPVLRDRPTSHARSSRAHRLSVPPAARTANDGRTWDLPVLAHEGSELTAAMGISP